ncbi:UNVERIFIED_CONTAM: hypothetical protein PYX00_002924 [Menopon gallinae]|uniref:Multidrug resistance-associated protein 5 n=1 Tax=Menopon gallinae TaxID=328185 RepID=A0AAW2HZC7_9NEOP
MTKETLRSSQIFQDVVLEPSDDDGNAAEVDQERVSEYSYRPYVIMTPRYVPNRGLTKYNAALKHLLPFRKRERKKSVIPVDGAGLFSLTTFSWLSKLIYQAYKKGITLDDIPLCSPFDTCSLNAERLGILWQAELDKKGPKNASFRRVAQKFMQTRVIVAFLVYILSCMFGFICPAIFMRKLIEFASDPDGDPWEGLMWAFAFTFSELMKTLTLGLYHALSYRTAIRLRSACLVLAYKKLIYLNSLGSKSIGGIINIYGSDGGRLFYLVVFGPMVIGGPIIVICCAFYIYFIFGPWGLLGLSTFLFFFPLQYLLSKITASFKQYALSRTDERIRLITEMLNIIKLIKIYAWEGYFLKQIQAIRNEELALLQKAAYCQSIGTTLTPTIPVITGILVFIIHVLSGYNLTAAQGILLLEDNEQYVERSTDKTLALCMNEGTFTWFNHSDEITEDNKKKKKKKKKEKEKEVAPEGDDAEDKKLTDKIITQPFRLESINLCVTKGSLIGICGTVGSGKTALLQACLGQMKKITGQVSKSGRSAFVSQEPWIENTTLKENILFGEPYDPKRYINTLYCCALNEDVKYLPAGDETEIGERGVNLSGGQKQRVSLARALYSNRDIYFLDDPFSAVDTHVAAHIFENYILNALSNKTVFLVTHHMRFLRKCDEILVVKEGRIVERGTHHELLSKGREYFCMVESSTLISEKNVSETSTVKEEEEGEETEQKNDINKAPNSSQGKKFIEAEKMIRGEVKPYTYVTYIRVAGGFFISFIVFMSIFLTVGSISFSSWWLAVWLKAGSGNTTIIDPNTNETIISPYINDNPDLHFYMEVYAGIIALVGITSLVRGLTYTKIMIRASRVLHKNILEKMMRSRLRHFEVTPIGRIQNIFSRDFDEIDYRLPVAVETLLQNIWGVIFAFLLITVVFPWFIVAIIILGVLYFLVGKIFRVAIRDLKRIEAVTRAPIFSTISATLNGLSIIQAFGKETEYLSQFYKKFDEHTVCSYLSNCAMRWQAIRLDSISVVVALTTSLLVVILKGEVAPALAGLALAYSAQISGIFQYTIRLMSETEGRFISVERVILNMKQLHEETCTKKTIKVASGWPSHGTIKFQDVVLSYSRELPPVLNGISFEINSGEKIGIVGRTGAGKSSLVAAIFRLVELDSGAITIDGVDISLIPLPILRSRITVIPQDPVIFTGTLRSNLDPYNKYSDEIIWNVLKQTKLYDKVQSIPNGLSAVFGERGDVLSVGENQLLCLARALLRSSKILILDEATASVDPDTETAVQTIIDKDFKHCTILTIAHRLKTVKNCDKVLVLNHGMVQEFDDPKTLMENPNSLFSSMSSVLK